MKKYLLILSLAAVLLHSGCVVGRRTVSLAVPSLGVGAEPLGVLRIASVDDNRVFQNKPADPSMPSIDGDVTGMSSDQKSVMIGRQRNTYGKAMGDIALPSGDSVTSRARALLEGAFKRRGYTISTDASTPNTATVSVDEFWAWFTPGMWSVTFEARVYCTIMLQRGDSTAKLVIKGYGINRGQVAKDANWQLAFDRAFHDFLVKFDTELNATGSQPPNKAPEPTPGSVTPRATEDVST